jgi:hypothetical protein
MAITDARPADGRRVNFPACAEFSASAACRTFYAAHTPLERGETGGETMKRRARTAIERRPSDWVNIVRGEFQELPGLALTKPQVQRLWGFDANTCDVVLRTLVEAHFLKKTAGGAYARFDAGC